MPLVLIFAFAASLGLHVAALFGPEIDLSTEPESPPPLIAELRPPPKVRPPPVSEPARKVVPKVVPKVVTTAVKKAVPQAVENAADVATPTPGASAQLSVPGAEQRQVSPASPPAAAAEEPPAIPYLPEAGQILYRVDRGDKGFEIGRASSSWEVVDGAYVLRLHTETTGIVWLFKRYRIDMESRGRLTADGLQPEQFVIRRNGGESGENARFDWQEMKVSVGANAPQALSPGAQDLLSFNFHLGFMPDPRVAQTLPIATGKKYGVYRLEAVGDEEIDLPVGKVRTLHLRAPGVNTTELWLAYDYLLLPVKIRHEDGKGDSFVQLATDIRLGILDND